MAYTRRHTDKDATWQRAWTADALSDLTSISALGGSYGPRHGDIAFVTATGFYYIWLDNNTWTQISGLSNPVVNVSPVVLFPDEGDTFPSIMPPGQGLTNIRPKNWTPTDASGATLTFTVIAATYSKIGSIVFFTFNITYPVTANGANPKIAGLPYIANVANQFMLAYQATLNPNIYAVLDINANILLVNGASVQYTNAALSGLTLFIQGFYLSPVP